MRYAQAGAVLASFAAAVAMGGFPLRFAGALAVFAVGYVALLSVRPTWTRGWSGGFYAVLASTAALSAAMLLPISPLLFGGTAAVILVAPPMVIYKLWRRFA